MSANNTIGGTDTNPHPSVQAWSKGDLFPAIISTVEKYDRAMTREEWDAANTQISRCSVADKLYAGYVELFYARPLAERLQYTAIKLQYRDFEELYASYDDAAQVARHLLDGGVIVPSEDEHEERDDFVGNAFDDYGVI